jgi:hypothetical protein
LLNKDKDKKKTYKYDYNIRYLRYFNEILFGIKGPKSIALLLKKKIENFLESNLHLNLLDKNINLININSDKAICFNVIITSKNKKQLLLNDVTSKSIQQKNKNKNKKKKILRDIKGIEYNKEMNIKKESKLSLFYKIINNRREQNEVKKSLMKEKNLIIPSFRESMNSIVIAADLEKIKRFLRNTGLLNKKNRPIAFRSILSLDSYYIINFYNEISKLIWNTFSVCDNYKDVLKIINYHVK